MVAVSMIAGDDWRPDEIKTLLASIEPHVHAIYVNWNGTERKPRWGNWTSTPIHYMQTEWTDDFAAARQAAYLMVPKKKYGWWMWMDCDDMLVAPDGLSSLFDALDPYERGIWMRYAYGIEPETGDCVVEQWRERILSLDWVWMWKWPIHEICIGPQGTAFSRADGPETSKVYIEHLRKAGEDRGAKERNRRIIVKAMNKEPNEPRYAYYYAKECMRAADLEPAGPKKNLLADAAIIQYRKFLNMVAERGAHDDAYGAAVSIGDLFLLKDDPRGAVDAYLQAAKFYPDWPEAWLGAARGLMKMGEWERMRGFADIASKLSKPVTSAALEVLDYGYNPLILRAVAEDEMGNYEAALADYKAALKIYRDPKISVGDRIKKIKKKLRDTPKTSAREERIRLRGTRADKSICFYTNPIAENWNQTTLATGGHGGAETLILELAPRFAADGWRVAVFGCPGDSHLGLGQDGVEYWRSEDWLPVEPYTVFVSSRAAAPFSGPVESKQKYLWMHDVNIGPGLRSVVGKQTKIIPISHWHQSYLRRLYGIPDQYMHVIPNGIDIDRYPEAGSYDDGHRFIWTSSPDRGLEYLMALWPNIREILPDATLDIFYGWDFIDRLLEKMPDHPIRYLKVKMGYQWENLGGEEAGLKWWGRVSPVALAALQCQSNLWAYPTTFMETYCLSAVQAQAAGCVPMTTSLAALKENVACDWLQIDGWAANVDYQRRYLELIEAVTADTPAASDLREQARQEGRRLAERNTIDIAYSRWNDLFLAEGLEV